MVKNLTDKTTILVTGAAGFIGFHIAKCLLELGECIVGYDNVNDYYSMTLKEAWLSVLQGFEGFSFVRADLAD